MLFNAGDVKKYSELIMRTYTDHYYETDIANYMVCRRVNRDLDVARCGAKTDFLQDKFEQCTTKEKC